MAYHRTEVIKAFSGPRAKLRRDLVLEFLGEQEGTGKGPGTTRYTYKVDQSRCGFHIELWRPAMLNKGIDFTVRVPGLIFSKLRAPWCSVPRHDDLRRMLRQARRYCPGEWSEFQAKLLAAYKCRPLGKMPRLAATEVPKLCPRGDAIPGDVVILVAKWLFAEQDITYWNQSGRAMLMRSLIDCRLMPRGSEQF